MLSLLRTKHFLVTLDEDALVLRRTRTTERFGTLAVLEAEYAELLRVMDRIDRTRYAQLIDARQSPPRNDPEFEAVVASFHSALYRGFRANAVLVRSAVGRLQVKRMLEASGVDALVFHDEAKALAYLAGGGRDAVETKDDDG